MTVKVKRKEEMMGKVVEVTIYLPEDLILTRERRLKADKVDLALLNEAEKINKEYEKLDKSIRNNEINKWRWLGSKLDIIITTVNAIEETDIANHYLWPAIGQYLRDELKRGLDDRKRSGTKNDHYRKCWLLHTVPGTEWITSWVGWDAFTDRGAQLVHSNNFIQLLGKKFMKHRGALTSDDFKDLIKLVVKYIPTQSKNPADMESMSEKKILDIIELIYADFEKSRS
jgi:hypothetical protein